MHVAHSLNPMKEKASELAVCGGTPAFSEKLHVGRPNIPDQRAFFARVQNMFESKWLSNNGPYVQELEKELCKYLGVRHCIPVCNGTIALEIAIRAASLTGEVIVPSFTFIATPHSLQWQEITPVFCEVDPKTHLLDPAAVERAITPKTTGIMPVHVWGQACEPEAFEDIAKRHKLKVIYDAAHAFGCSDKGKMIGNFGLAEVFSFHATKFYNTFEGGAIATNDDELAQSMRLMKNFGFAGLDNAVLVGTNGKMTEVCAAMGITNLESIQDFIDVNIRNYRQYLSELCGLPGVSMLVYDESEKRNYQHIVLDVDPETSLLTRDELIKVLWAENVLVRRYFYPGCHRMQPYRSRDIVQDLPITDRISAGVMVLPSGTAVSPNDISKVCDIIRVATKNAAELKRSLTVAVG